MAEQLTAEELAEFREIFNLVDRDGGGTISQAELGELMDTLGIDVTPEELGLMISEVDENHNGMIDFSEFVAVMSRRVKTTYTADQVISAFKLFEGTAPPGHVKPQALIKALMTYGTEKLSEDQARELVSQLQVNSEGFINYAEYVNTMMSK